MGNLGQDVPPEIRTGHLLLNATDAGLPEYSGYNATIIKINLTLTWNIAVI
jgi:hypothetical protein